MTRSYLALVSLLAIAGCNGTVDAPHSLARQSIGTGKFADVSIVGALNYGNTSNAVAYTSSPRYRALSFTGVAGDQVTANVSSSDGDAIAWLIDSAYHIVAANDDASDDTTDAHLSATLAAGGTFYIVFRDLNLQNATLTVSLACAGGSCAAVCTPGAVQCSGVQPQVCSPAGQWTNQGSACAGACLAGVCVDCAPGSKQCSGLTAQTCDATGHWTNTPCGVACNNGVCLGCQPGSTQCAGNEIIVCDGNGQWEVSTTCPTGYGCVAGGMCECVTPPPTCAAGMCGVHTNSCGESIDCGQDCGDNGYCYKGYCKVTQTCPCGGTPGHCKLCL